MSGAVRWRFRGLRAALPHESVGKRCLIAAKGQPLPRPYNRLMLELSRTVRFCLNDPPALGRGTTDSSGDAAGVGASRFSPEPITNGYAGWPAMRGLGRFYALTVRCMGRADPVTGYFVNIKQIDRAVRDEALPIFQRHLQQAQQAGAGDAAVPMGRLLRDVLDALQASLEESLGGGEVAEASLALSPFHRIAITRNNMDHVTLRQQFEFAAAHRLHVDALSSEANRATFGKCNNPSGHGHNYRVEVAVRAPIDEQGQVMSGSPATTLDAIVDEHAIQALDHKHLNIDVPAFAELNPSVENIAKVVFDMLASPIADAGATLDAVTVWETEKTSCTYTGREAQLA